MTEVTWRSGATCRDLDDTDRALFFGDKREQQSAIERFCSFCPVRQACLDEALGGEDDGLRTRYGVWGGLTADQRAEDWRQRQKRERAAGSLSVVQVAERLGCSESTIHRRLVLGQLVGGFRVGRNWWVDPERLDEVEVRRDTPAMAVSREALKTRRAEVETMVNRGFAEWLRSTNHREDTVVTILTKLPPDLLSIPQAAARLGISRELAYAMADRGELPGAFRVGRQWRVSVVRLERYMHGEPVGEATDGELGAAR